MIGLSTKAAATVRRRALIVVFAAALGMIGAWAATTVQETSYRARAVVAVPVFDQPDEGEDAPADGPALGRPLDASRLALSYTSLIREDRSILEAVSDETGRELDDFAGTIEVENTPDTPLIEIVVAGSEADAVSETLTSFVAALTGPQPAMASIAPGSLQTVRIEEPVASTGAAPLVAILAGLVLGSAIGLVVAVFWERSQPRIDTSSEITALLGLPAHDTRELTDGSGTWILQRWSDLAGESGRVFVVPGEPTKRTEVSAIVAEFSESLNVTAIDRPQQDAPYIHPVKDLAIAVPDHNSASAHRPLLVRVVNPWSTINDVDPRGDQAGVVVMAVARGTRVAEVGATVDLLTSAGVTPGWAIVHD